MRKEVLYAIIAGISIGLLAAFGTWRVSKLVKVTPAPVTKKEVITTKNIDSVTIDGLKNYDVVIENPTIKGLYTPNADIVISTQDSDYYVKSNSEGEFELQIEIPAGLSIIKINDTKLALVYSTEVEAGSVSYAGTITDISSGTIQVKGEKGEIKQISTAETTTYINTLKKNIEVKQTDLAIGDYIVAIGKTNNNKVLSTERILITSPLVENKMEFKKILIEKISKTSINDIKLPTKWNGPNIKDLSEGQEIIIVGTTENEKYTLRSIFITVE